MKDTKTAKWSAYRLLKQSDAVSFFHMQMPQWLFFDPGYTHLPLEAKVTYTFLLNRFQLSRMNGWVNGDGEVFIIYPREKLAGEIGISYRKAIQCFRELAAAGLIWEHRVGRGAANRIYMAAVELSEEAAGRLNAPGETGSAETAGLAARQEPLMPEDHPGGCEILDESPDFCAPAQELKETRYREDENHISRPVIPACPEVRFWHPIKTEERKAETSDTEKVSPSRHARARMRDRPADSEEDMLLLDEVLDNCELYVLPEEESGASRNAVTRLFYSDSFRVGSAPAPGCNPFPSERDRRHGASGHKGEAAAE